MTRRRLLASFLGTGTIAASYSAYLEPRWLEVNRHRVALKRAPLARPIRLLHLSDLHASVYVPFSLIEYSIRVGLAEAPDLICVTGDFITTNRGFDADEYARALWRLSAAAPTFAVLGNHDGGAWAADRWSFSDHRVVESILAASGIELLHNRAQPVAVGTSRVTLVGLGDLWSGDMDPARAFSDADADGNRPVLLLAHNPDSKDYVKNYTWDLMLSGHTHGGQIIVPFAGAPFAPVKDKRYIAGLKPWGSRQIHVTRGVGSYGGIRFNCRPEVSLLVVG
jgi:predicted MPP superfamily phosphohydrolase